jgi:hypothetical protein
MRIRGLGQFAERQSARGKWPRGKHPRGKHPRGKQQGAIDLLPLRLLHFRSLISFSVTYTPHTVLPVLRMSKNGHF